MKLSLPLLLGLVLLTTSCDFGKAKREQTLSILNTEADKWDGGQKFVTDATDAYGHPVTATVEKTTLNYVLEVRSNGPDGLPKNSDDIVVTRSKRHGETTITEEAAKATEAVTGAAASGAIKGIKKGLGLGGKDDKNKDDKKK